MEIYVIESLEQVNELRWNWDRVYELDPEAQFFVSWIWISGYLERHSDCEVPWIVLAAKPGPSASSYVAFFPLKIGIERDDKLGLYSQFSMAGVTDSFHQGFISIPEYEEECAIAFASYLQDQEQWTEFALHHIQRKKSRLTTLFNTFSKSKTRLVEDSELYKNELDDIDNSICPYVPLPNHWEEYLQILGSSTRKNIRKKLKRFSNSDEFYITETHKDNLDQNLGALLNLWRLNWEGRKGAEKCSIIVENWYFFLKHCFENDCLYLPVLWQENKPVGAVAHFVDTSRKELLSFLSARDEDCSDLPPGLILHAESIRYAIQNNFRTYDFLMGNEEYKYSFGAKERYIATVKVHRIGVNKQNIRLNRRTIPQALQIARRYHRANHLIESKEAYQRILDSQPENHEALYGLAVIMQRENEYEAAAALLKSLLNLQPDRAEAWFSLGVLYQTQEQYSSAERAYYQVLRTDPQSNAVMLATYHNLGYSLQQQGNWDRAIDYYQKARDLQPESIEAEVIWANALYAQGALSSEEQFRYSKLNYELGEQRRKAGDLKTAIQYFQQALSMNPKLKEAYYCLGLVLRDQDSLEEAIRCLEKVRELDPHFENAEIVLANIYFQEGTLPTSQYPHYAEANVQLGIQHVKRGKFESAIEHFRRAIAMNPTVAAHTYLGSALYAQGDIDTAILSYQNAMELQPDFLEARVGLANIFYDTGQLKLEEIKQCAEINYELGQVYQEAGNLSSAIDHYRRAIKLNPDLKEVRESLRLTIQENQGVSIKVSCAK